MIDPFNYLQEQIHAEVTMLRGETHRLQLSMQRYTGEDLSSLRYEDLDQLEKELERSLKKVRDRKVHIHCSFSTVFSIMSPAPDYMHLLNAHDTIN